MKKKTKKRIPSLSKEYAPTFKSETLFENKKYCFVCGGVMEDSTEDFVIYKCTNCGCKY